MDYPENQGREEHGEGACEVNPVKYGGRKGEFSTDKIEQKILRKKVKENSDAREYRCNLPLDSAEERLNTLHEETHHGVKYNTISKAQRFYRIGVDCRVSSLWAQRVLSVPEEAAQEGEQ